MTYDELANFFDLPVRVYIEFVNADMDGTVLDSDEGHPAVRHFTKMIYVATESGLVGKSVVSIPLSKVLAYLQGDPMPEVYMTHKYIQHNGINHRYTIVNRMEEGDAVWLQVRHSVIEREQSNDS